MNKPAPNKITAHNAGWRSQFRFAVHGFWSGVCESSVRRPRIMKRFLPSVIWFTAGAVLGQLAETVLFQLWDKVGLLIPVARWFHSHGDNTMVKCWFIFWVNVPNWFLVAMVGILGGLLIKRCLVLNLLLFGFGFALVPLALYAYLNSYVPTFGDVARHAVLIALAVLCGLLSYRWARPPNTDKARTRQ
jgi:hypothetical protein